MKNTMTCLNAIGNNCERSVAYAVRVLNLDGSERPFKSRFGLWAWVGDAATDYLDVWLGCNQDGVSLAGLPVQIIQISDCGKTVEVVSKGHIQGEIGARYGTTERVGYLVDTLRRAAGSSDVAADLTKDAAAMAPQRCRDCQQPVDMAASAWCSDCYFKAQTD